MELSDPEVDGGSAPGFLRRFSRRLLLASGAAVLAGLAAARSSPALSAAGGADDRFMALSRLLIPHQLDPEIGRRIAAGLRADASPLSDHIDALLKLAHDRKAAIVEDFFPFAPADAQASALSIISAWYLGVVDNTPSSQVIAFELALMFKPTSDVMTIPTYSISGPNGWGPEAPALGAMPTF